MLIYGANFLTTFAEMKGKGKQGRKEDIQEGSPIGVSLIITNIHIKCKVCIRLHIEY